MASLCTYEVAYPEIVHPLINQKKQLKEKYIQLLRYYAELLSDDIDKEKSFYRLNALSKILLNKSVTELPLFDKKAYRMCLFSVNRTKFTPFRLFSYRYLLLFDALFVLGIENKKVGNRLCEEILRMTNRRYHKSLKTMTEKMYNGDITFAKKRVMSPEMIKAWIDAREYLSSKEKKITFTATMSAGKSTLINALIGSELSFSKKAACTSTVMKFLTAPCKTHNFCVSDGSSKLSFMSEQEVRTFTNVLSSPCEIMGHFDSPLTTRKVTVVDTPGVNSYLNPKHKKITREELKTGTDILVYVIPVESYGSEDDYVHLSYIKKNISYKRILFVVNMMDSCDFEDDSTEEIICDITDHLSEIGFEKPIVCPMSAKAGLLLKKAVTGAEMSNNDKKACKTFATQFTDENLQLGKYYPELNLIKNNKADDLLWQAFVSTGLPEFEELLYRYIREE